MKRSLWLFAFVALTLLLVMPPGTSEANIKKCTSSEFVVQSDLNEIQPFFAPDVEVTISSCASCTGESWVYQPLTVSIITNEEIISPKHNKKLLLMFDLDKMNGLKSKENIKRYSQCDIEYSM